MKKTDFLKNIEDVKKGIKSLDDFYNEEHPNDIRESHYGYDNYITSALDLCEEHGYGIDLDCINIDYDILDEFRDIKKKLDKLDLQVCYKGNWSDEFEFNEIELDELELELMNLDYAHSLEFHIEENLDTLTDLLCNNYELDNENCEIENSCLITADLISKLPKFLEKIEKDFQIKFGFKSKNFYDFKIICNFQANNMVTMSIRELMSY